MLCTPSRNGFRSVVARNFATSGSVLGLGTVLPDKTDGSLQASTPQLPLGDPLQALEAPPAFVRRKSGTLLSPHETPSVRRITEAVWQGLQYGVELLVDGGGVNSFLTKAPENGALVETVLEE